MLDKVMDERIKKARRIYNPREVVSWAREDPKGC